MLGLIIGLSVAGLFFITAGYLLLKASAKENKAYEEMMQKHKEEQLQKELEAGNKVEKLEKVEKEQKGIELKDEDFSM